jgi:hypothetical protein
VTSCFCGIGRKKISTDQSKEHVKWGTKLGYSAALPLDFLRVVEVCYQNAGNASSLPIVSRLIKYSHIRLCIYFTITLQIFFFCNKTN